MFQKLSEWWREPLLKNKFNGATVTCQKIDKPLHSAKSNEEVSEGPYYQLDVEVDGKNTEYSAQEKPLRFIFGVSNSETMRFSNSVHLGSTGGNYKSFMLCEEKNDGKPGIFGGRTLPPHHNMVLKAVYVDASGQEQSVKVALMTRRTEETSYAWKQAMMHKPAY